MVVLFIVLIAVAALCVTWYCVAARRKQRKAREVLRWIQSALAGRGQVIGISWTGASQFCVPLRLTCGVFHRASVLVEMRAQQTPAQWKFECLQPLIISTRPEQQKEIACAMASLTRSESSEFLNVSFQRSSPHFSATLLLESLAPGSAARGYMLDAMRELAGSASASLF
jgi:hypothetical protein